MQAACWNKFYSIIFKISNNLILIQVFDSKCNKCIVLIKPFEPKQCGSLHKDKKKKKFEIYESRHEKKRALKCWAQNVFFFFGNLYLRF